MLLQNEIQTQILTTVHVLLILHLGAQRAVDLEVLKSGRPNFLLPGYQYYFYYYYPLSVYICRNSLDLDIHLFTF